MAAWQVDFTVVPRRALAAHGAAHSSNLDDTPWWGTHALPPDYQRRLGAITSPGASSIAELQTWGVEDGNRIDVWSEAGRVRAVIARVDVRRLDSKFGAALLQFVRTADAVLVRSDGLIVEPQIGAYAAALRSSVAWQFASDPTSFLATYSDDDNGE